MQDNGLWNKLALTVGSLAGLTGCSGSASKHKQTISAHWFRSCAACELVRGSITGLYSDGKYVYVAGATSGFRGGVIALDARSGEVAWERLGIGQPFYQLRLRHRTEH